MSSFFLFDSVYIINLDYRTDRLREIKKQLVRIGETPSSPSFTFFTAKRPVDRGEFPTCGARGCFESHASIIDEAIKKKQKRILILEDDCNFSSSFRIHWPVITQSLLSMDWSFFYGGYRLPRGQKPNVLVGSNHLTEIDSHVPIGCTHFVAMQGETLPEVRKFLNSVCARPAGDPLGGPMYIDGAYSDFRRRKQHFTTLISVPQLGYQRSSRSDIVVTKESKSSALCLVLGSLRRLRNRFLG